VVNHGGRAVGKSTSMPYWNLTIGQQGVADVIAYLKVTFKGPAQITEAAASPADGGPSGACVQPRKTQQAPAEFLEKTNPLPASVETVQAGKTLFLETAKPLACMNCHGANGDGKGPAGMGLMPPPRNFTCGEMMKDIPDGQLFWIIKNGSPGTGMMPFSGLPDDEVWQLIHYLRTLTK
jgi:mono/diheme cytochrome c family protein